MRTLDRKVTSVRSGSSSPDDFVLVDAKDADMAYGLTAAGPDPTGDSAGGFRTRTQYLADMTAVLAQGEVDVLLTSASNGERLAADGVLAGSATTLAVRANDTTDMWRPRESSYASHPSRPFQTADLAMITPFCDLVLYSVRLNNELDHDIATLRAYTGFRREAHAAGVRHVLEVFNPNAPSGLAAQDVAAFVNDSIIRLLASVTDAERPLFLSTSFNGGQALEELTRHDPTLMIGVIGGPAGTTRDTLELLVQARGRGARAAVLGRKIQRAESQRDLLVTIRRVLRAELSTADGVATYHDMLRSAGVTPLRSLDRDQEISEPVLRRG